MEELLKYFQKIESRLADLEENAKAEPQQEEKLARLAQLAEALAAKNAVLETQVAELQQKVKELEARPVAIAPIETEEVAENDEVAIDEESGEPELEVEFVEETEEETVLNESEEVIVDEETGEPELEVEFVDEPEEEPQPAADPIIEAEPVIEVAEEEVTVEPVSAEPVVAEPIEEEKPAVKEAVTTVLDAAQQGDTLSSVVPKLEDIRKGITMGDRFLFQRELFANNGELMTKTIEELNALGSLAEAEAYIGSHFQWDKESNAYELFHNLLKRRW